MKLRQLQCLCAVVDCGFNISRAAELLHATQPAVGKQLRQLEEELGCDLLVRQGGRLLGLTPPGEQALGWARQCLQCADNLRGAVRLATEEAGGTIELATSHTHAKVILLPALLAFRRRYPQVRIAVQQGSPDQVAELVRDGKATLGVIHLPPQLPKEVVAAPFLSTRQVLALPVGHPLLDAPELTLARIAAYPLIMQSPARPQGTRILQRFEQAGLEVDVAVQALDADVMKAYVAAGLGIAVIPGFLHAPEQDPALRVRDIDHLFPPAVSAVLLRRRSVLHKGVYALLEHLSAVLDRRRVDALVFEEVSGPKEN